MKQWKKAGAILCLILGIALVGTAGFAQVNQDQAAALTSRSKAGVSQEAKEELAALLGESLNELEKESADETLTQSEEALLWICTQERWFLTAGVDLILAGAFWGILELRKKRCQDSPVLSRKKQAYGNNITGILMAFLVLLLNLSLASSSFLTVNNLLNVMQQISVNFILAIGMSFALLSGGIDLSVGSSVAFTALAAGIMMKSWNLPVAVTLVVCLAAATLIGAVNGILIARLTLPPFIATLGTMSILRGADYTITGGATLSQFPSSFLALSGRVFGIPVIGLLIIAAVFLAAWYLLKYTSFGRYVYAVGGNEKCSELSGLNVQAVKVKVYAICGFCAGLAGILLASRLNSVTPTTAEGAEMDAIAAVIIGGTSMSGGSGSIVGTMIGAMIIAFISNGLNLLGVGQGPQKMVKGVIIVIAVIIDVVRRRAAKSVK